MRTTSGKYYAKKKEKSQMSENIVQFNTIKKEKEREKEKSLLEEFKDFIKDDDSTASVIGFLAKKSAQLIEKYEDYDDCLNGFSERDRKELYEFYDYFAEEYEEIVSDAIFEVWYGEQPLILSIIEDLYDEDCERRDEELIKNMPKEIIKEAESLCEKIFAIRKNKEIHCTNTYDIWSCSIPKTIPRDMLQDYKAEFIKTCAKIIADEFGTMIVLYADSPTSKRRMFGVVGKNNKWIPIPKDELKKTDLQSQRESGIKENRIYEEITRD